MSTAAAPLPGSMRDAPREDGSLRRALADALARHRPPHPSLRVLIGCDPGGELAEHYLRVRARVVGSGDDRHRDPRYHALLELDPWGLPAPRRRDDADLIVLPRVEQPRNALLALATALAPGGRAVFAVPAAPRDWEALVATAGLDLHERHPVDDHDRRFEVVVVSDPRPATTLPLGGTTLDRAACVDRKRIAAALSREPWMIPRRRPDSGSTDALLQVLHQQLTRGEPDVRRLPWPYPVPASPGHSSSVDTLVVMPHPDDESVYAGGTLAALSAIGQRVALLVATDGAGGRGGHDLRRRRAKELLDAARILGLHSVRCLGWTDFGKYRDEARTEPYGTRDALLRWQWRRGLRQLVAEIRRSRPRRLLGLDPELDPNLSMHGHHLGLGLLLAIAFHVAADPAFGPELGPAWACAEHRVIAPLAHAERSEVLEIDRDIKRRALAAHRSQAYSTASLIEALDDPDQPAVEVCRRLQSRRRLPWILARRHDRPARSIDWSERARQVRAVARPHAEIAAVLRMQAESDGLDSAARASVQRLARGEALAVVTGQQVGLLGGPAYTLAKALGAIALARRLSAQGISAVPIFWMATQDHDLAEVQKVARLDARPLSLGLQSDGGPVGSRVLSPRITELLDRWESDLSVPALDVVAMLRRTYRPGHDFAGAFASLLRTVTRGTGLLVLDPTDPRLARFTQPLLQRAARDAAEVDEALERAHRRQGEQTIQPRPGQTQVFVIDDDGLRRRVPAPAPDAVLRSIARHPERASGSALLRPLLQDTLLPTIAYVAGPTERRYLAQLDELYAWAGLPAPTVVARPTLTLASPHDHEALMEVGGLEQLRTSPRPFEQLGRTGLGPVARRWLTDVEERLAWTERARFDGSMRMDLRPSTWIEDLDRHAAQLTSEDTPSRTAQHWLVTRRDLLSRLDDVEKNPSARAFTRLRYALVRLRRSLLRDGRRAAARSVAAWRRLSDDPAPPERRMTVAEWVARAGPSAVPALLTALELQPEADLLLTIGAPT